MALVHNELHLESHVYFWTPWYRRDGWGNEGIWCIDLKMAKGKMYEFERFEFNMDMSLKKDLIPRFLLLKKEI